MSFATKRWREDKRRCRARSRELYADGCFPRIIFAVGLIIVLIIALVIADAMVA